MALWFCSIFWFYCIGTLSVVNRKGGFKELDDGSSSDLLSECVSISVELCADTVAVLLHFFPDDLRLMQTLKPQSRMLLPRDRFHALIRHLLLLS